MKRELKIGSVINIENEPYYVRSMDNGKIQLTKWRAMIDKELTYNENLIVLCDVSDLLNVDKPDGDGMTEHTFIFKNGEYHKDVCEYCRELETDNWHYYKCENGVMMHVRKDAIAAIKGGTYADVIKNKVIDSKLQDKIHHSCKCKE